MFGLGFFKVYGAKLDLIKGSVELNGVVCPLFTRTEVGSCCRLYARNDVNVSPRFRGEKVNNGIIARSVDSLGENTVISVLPRCENVNLNSNSSASGPRKEMIVSELVGTGTGFCPLSRSVRNGNYLKLDEKLRIDGPVSKVCSDGQDRQ